MAIGIIIILIIVAWIYSKIKAERDNVRSRCNNPLNCGSMPKWANGKCSCGYDPNNGRPYQIR